ncbi:MAG: hypothetical protein EOO13_02440 [Chitinophagaceae bacterium]|nr:MAG: hypothetical protein EOO13_02440 [Chitinophagaceae bacterium]
MKQIILFSLFSIGSISCLHAQEACKVSTVSLQGTYTGECKEGKANGRGKAVGTDTYEGEFKNGVPDGNGVLSKADKSVYTGSFKKGLMDGSGKLKYSLPSGTDTVINGFWKKDKYVGQYEKAFEIHDRTGKVDKIDIRMAAKGNAKATINITGGNANAAAPGLSSIVVMAGQYISENTSSTGNSTFIRVQQIIFPFRARFYFNNGEMVDISFYEQADFDVNIVFL